MNKDNVVQNEEVAVPPGTILTLDKIKEEAIRSNIERIRPEKISMKVGAYSIITVDTISNTPVRFVRGMNLITKQGPSILAKCYGGDIKFKAAYMYGEHAPDGTYGDICGLDPTTDDRVSTMRTAPRSTTDAEVPIIYSNYSNDSGYDFNIVTFTASFNSASLNNRQFVGAGLVSIANGEEYLFNHAYYPTHLKTLNHDIIIIWSIKFTVA